MAAMLCERLAPIFDPPQKPRKHRSFQHARTTPRYAHLQPAVWWIVKASSCPEAELRAQIYAERSACRHVAKLLSARRREAMRERAGVTGFRADKTKPPSGV